MSFLYDSIANGLCKVGIHFSSSLIPNLNQAFFEECDTDLAKQSLPADLKLMEGILKSDLNNKQLLTALCMGFTGCAMLWEASLLLYISFQKLPLCLCFQTPLFLSKTILSFLPKTLLWRCYKWSLSLLKSALYPDHSSNSE